MKIYRVRKEDVSFFKELDPFDRLSIIENPMGFALVAMNEDDDQKEAAGILIGTITEKRITVDWIAVTPEYSGHGIGEELLLNTFFMADENDIDEICAVMSFEYGTESFSKGAESYFEERFFEKEEEAYGDMIISLSELKEMKFFDQNLSKLPKAVALSSFKAGEVQEICDKLCSIDEAEMLFQKEDAKSLPDRDLSYVIMDEEEPCGGLLVQEAGECLLPIYYYAESKNESAALVLSSMQAALEKYEDRDVLILQRGKKVFELLSRIFNAQRGSKIMTADLSVFREYSSTLKGSV